MNTLAVRNPRTGVIDYSFPLPDSQMLVHQCTLLRHHQTSWEQVGLVGRIKVLQQWKDVLQHNRAEVLQALVTDTGRLSESTLEFDALIRGIERWCRQAPDLLKVEERRKSILPFIELGNEYVPYQLVGVISPWNFPLLLSTIDVIPALLAGCAVIVKPSEVTPRFVEPLNRTIASVPLLHDVLAFVVGAGETGSALIEQVDLICFTGSVSTGQRVAETAARHFIPAFLELGGKDPAIVLESADLEHATSAILWGSVANCGQSCQSIERIYVAESIFAPFVDLLVGKAQRLQLSYPDIESGQIGPIIAERQASIIAAQLHDAIAKGALIACGGTVKELGGGLWCRPTVLTAVNHTMQLMREETFGPLMPVMTFSSVEEAIHLANDTIYGLSGAIFAGSIEEATAVARQLEAGAISINDASLTAIVYESEKNSFKFSGMGGSRMGSAAMTRFLRKKALLVNTGATDPWWFSE